MPEKKKDIKKLMKSHKGRVLLVGLLLLLLVSAFLIPTGIKKVIEWNRPAETIFEPVFPIQPEQVTGIDIKGKGERISLIWQDDSWQFTHPSDARTNTRAVHYFLMKVCQWVPEREYSVLKQSEQESRSDAFGFEYQSVRYVLSDQVGKKYTVTTGGQEKITNRIFAKVEDSQTVFLLPRLTFIEIDGLAYRLRDHHLFEKPLTDIVRINFREDQLAMTLERNDGRSKQKIMPIFGKENKLATVYDSQTDQSGWQVIYPYKIPANQEVVELLLDTLSHWEATKFVEESVGARTDLSKYGLSDPYGEIILLSANGRYPKEVKLGRPYGEKGPVFVKTSMNSKIVQIRPEALQSVQSLFNTVPSRQLVHFLEKVSQIEILTSRWRIAMVQESDVWEASLQERLSHKKKQVVKRDYRQKDELYFFSAESIIEELLSLEYIDTLNSDNPFYSGFREAKQVMKILFFKPNGNLLEVFKIFEPEDSDEIFYLQRQSDNDVYLVNQSIAGLILSEIEKSRKHKKKKP